jgi:hypothetical protein
MHAAARWINGVLLVRSSPGHGTRVDVRVPAAGKAGQPVQVASLPPCARVVIADGNAVLRFGLRAILEQAPGIEVVAEAANGEQMVQQVHSHMPDIVLLDARMLLPDGLAVIHEVSQLANVGLLASPADAALVY